MQCPKCGFQDTKVLDTRTVDDNRSIRRRRQCLECAHRFSTVESIFREDVFVVKRDGRKEEFSRAKILAGIEQAVQKRPVDKEHVYILVNTIINNLEERYNNNIPTEAIGESVMDGLKKIDQVAYVRFASVYKEFRDISEFKEAIDSLQTSNQSHS